MCSVQCAVQRSVQCAVMADVGEVSDSASVEEGGVWGHGHWQNKVKVMEGEIGFL